MNLIINTNIVRVATIAFVLVVVSACEGEGSSSSGSTGSVTGVAGSTSRMAIQDDYLYAIADNKIQLFLIDIPKIPNPWATVPVDWGIQTLFPYEDYLLVGAADGIHILDNSDPANPSVVGGLTHARTIDPVVAKDGYAYVTLKNDPQASNQVADQMNVVDLADIRNPQLVKEIGMLSPEGLVAIDNRLFVCDGPAGLKQYNLDDPANPLFVDVIRDVDCNDVIATGGVDRYITSANILYVITDTSLRQYDYSVSPPALLSIIETESMSADALIKALSGKMQI